MKHPMSRLALCIPLMSACAVTSHEASPSRLGTPSTLLALEASLASPGPVRFERVVAADWQVPLSGLLDLNHEKAEAAGLEDQATDIQIYFYVLEHPEHGTFLVDSGVQQALRTGEPTIASSLVASQMNLQALKVHRDTAAWLQAQPHPPAGVLLTHLHLDHVLGLVDLPGGTPVYVGPKEAEASRFINIFVQGTIDRALAGKDLRSLPPATRDGAFAGVYDMFGDGSVWALHVPGHTPGSLAFVVRSTEGPVLLVGDTSHTAWGWQQGVTPGEYTEDHGHNAQALEGLRALAARHPTMRVQLGHQALPDPAQGEGVAASARKPM